ETYRWRHPCSLTRPAAGWNALRRVGGEYTNKLRTAHRRRAGGRQMKGIFANAARAVLLVGTLTLTTAHAGAAAAVTYLFPAPPSLPAFGPIQLAKGKGYFTAAGLDVSFAVGRGGVDVAKQVGAGNAPLGGIVADAPIVVRQNGVPIRIVALFGGKGFMQLVVREDSGITKPADLKGKTISVMSYQDTTYYALLGLLASAGLTQNDVNIEAAGPVG